MNKEPMDHNIRRVITVFNGFAYIAAFFLLPVFYCTVSICIILFTILIKSIWHKYLWNEYSKEEYDDEFRFKIGQVVRVWYLPKGANGRGVVKYRRRITDDYFKTEYQIAYNDNIYWRA